MTLRLWGVGRSRAFRGMVVLDSYALFFNLVIGYATGLVLLLSIDYVRRAGIESGEFYILVLFAAVGMMLMATAGDLIVVFLGLETMSISLYVLAGFFRDRIEAGEASMKYFLLGAFASGFFLYGIALIFGATGSTNLDKIANAVAAGAGRDPHAADRLRPAPGGLRVQDLRGAVPHVGARRLRGRAHLGHRLHRHRLQGRRLRRAPARAPRRRSARRPGRLDDAASGCSPSLSMTFGNVVAIAQQNLKRMLAYSSIAHVGYMLVGVVAGGTLGGGSVLFYLLAYTFTTAGAFGVILLLERDGRGGGAARGLRRARRPASAGSPLALTLFLLSLIGIPPTAGFVGKFYLFGAAVRSGLHLAGRDRRAELRGRRLLLPAHHRLHVHARARGRARGDRARRVAGALALVVALWGVVQLGRHARAVLRPGPGRGRCPLLAVSPCGCGACQAFGSVPRLALRPRRHRLPRASALIPGAAEAIAALRAAGRRVGFLSNKPLETRDGLRRQAHAAGHARRRPTTSSTPRWSSRAISAASTPARPSSSSASRPCSRRCAPTASRCATTSACAGW